MSERLLLHRILTAVFCLCLVAACTKPVNEFVAGIACEADNFVVEDQFEGARRGDCSVFKDGHVRIDITAEEHDGEMNDSPWYAFRLAPKSPGTAAVRIRYHGGNHRYPPKWSTDGVQWHLIGQDKIKTRLNGIIFEIELQDTPVIVAAQELHLPPAAAAWSQEIAESDYVDRSILGHSPGGEAIYQLDINSNATEVVFLAGRQHPPEVTGAIGFRAFYKALLSDTDIANAYRARFHTVAIPMLNPDGVNAGHWRMNSQGADLNRDWGLFEQPETALIRDLLDQLDNQGKHVLASVDFHSTADNLIYRQEDIDETNPAAFTQRWIAASLARLPGYKFLDEPRPLSDLATSRNYMYKRYGSPAVTYEVGDNEDRETIRHAAQIFAEEFMRLLLESPRAVPQ